MEFNKVIKSIKESKSKLVLLQFADGLKPYATLIVDYLEKKIKNVNFIIWLGSCFGACDFPVGIENLKIDLIIQFGHNALMPDY